MSIVSKICTKISYKSLCYVHNLQKCFEMISSVFKARLKMLWYRSAIWIIIIIMWRVRVAPLIIICGFWITYIDLLNHTEVETTQSYHYSTLDTEHSETQLNCSWLTEGCLLNLDWLLTLYSISWSRLSADWREITSLQGSFQMSLIQLPREQSIPGRYRGNAYTGWFVRKRET
jgi:hypothetical protein